MKKFEFNLQTLLELNISLEKEQKGRLATINNRISMFNTELNLINSERKECIAAYLQLIRDSSSVDMVNAYNTYIHALNRNAFICRIKIGELSEKRDNLRERLIETMKKRKGIERLKEKQYKIFLEELNKEEEKVIDDYASFMYIKAGAEGE